jgi:Permuted papain-like amidase enzyme, YaeF/YiiX, C92 family
MKLLKYFVLLPTGSVILTWVFLAFVPPSIVSYSKSLALLHNVTREIPKGHLNGVHQGPPIHESFDILEPGDILLCHNRYGAYGFWTHAILYVGNGNAVDANDFSKGTELNPINMYRNYDAVAVFRADVSDDVRHRIAASAIREVGKPYDPFSGVWNEHAEYCSKLIWRVYHEEGILLSAPQHWILPDDLAKSSRLIRIVQWGGNG